MCDYSIQNAKTRPAEVGDCLVIRDFGMTTRGFAAINDLATNPTAVCLLPGTELAFDKPVEVRMHVIPPEKARVIRELTARFRQVNKESLHVHHDALEFGNGEFVLLTHLQDGQHATVLQLPAAPKTKQEAIDQTRVAVVA